MNIKNPGRQAPAARGRLRGKRICVTLAALLVTLSLAACGDDATPGRGFSYTITDSTGKLNVADRRVVVVQIGLTGCIYGPTTNIIHAGDAPVTTPGIVTLNFTASMPAAYLESVYIDVDGSNTLTNGDYVWGTDPYDLAGYCVPSVAAGTTPMSFDWTAFPGAVGTTTYRGGSMPFAAEGGPRTAGDGFAYLGRSGR